MIALHFCISIGIRSSLRSKDSEGVYGEWECYLMRLRTRAQEMRQETLMRSRTLLKVNHR